MDAIVIYIPKFMIDSPQTKYAKIALPNSGDLFLEQAH